jgi:hypothetical protein
MEADCIERFCRFRPEAKTGLAMVIPMARTTRIRTGPSFISHKAAEMAELPPLGRVALGGDIAVVLLMTLLQCPGAGLSVPGRGRLFFVA